MSRQKSRVLTDHELRLMNVLWRRGSASVADVVGCLSPPPLSYNTVLTTLRKLEQKHYVKHEEEGRAYIYSPLIARDGAAKSALRHLLDRFFGSSPGALALRLFDDGRLTGEDDAAEKRIVARNPRL